MTTDKKNPQPAETVEGAEAPGVGKGRPTPSRREREAANQRPLVSNNRSEAKAKQREARAKAQQGMMAGDERYLTARDKGPQRRYVRDYVDSRLGFSELVIPLMLVLLIVSVALPLEIQVYVTLGLWFVILLVAIDLTILIMLTKRRLSKKFGAESIQKGYRFYAAMRALQIRPLRLPKPQVKIGTKID